MKPTITDIARDTGLALSTISKYLNNKNVLPENQVLIEASIKKLGYTPNRLAQGLRARSSRTVALLIPSYSNYFWGNSVSYVTSSLWEKGFACTIHTYPLEETRQMQIVQLLINNSVCGVIAVTGTLTGKVLEKLAQNAIPLVLLDQILDTFPSDYVTSDNYRGGYLAGQYLAQKGHQRIGFIAGRPGAHTIAQRTKGFLDAVRDSGLPSHPEYYCYTSDSNPTGRELIQKLLSLKQPPTAVFFNSFELCLEAMTILAEYSISIPDQMSVITFDDDRMFSCLSPSITVIAQDFTAIGREAARLLLSRIEAGGLVPAQTVYVPVRLIERESVCML